MTAPALELRSVSLSRRGLPVLDAVDLSVPPRSTLAILGPNGGGKTTLLKVALGLIRPDRGEVRVLGTDPCAARGRVGYVPQHFGFDRDFPIRVRDVVLMGRLAARGPLRRLRARDREIAEQMLERVELADHAMRPIGNLSGGQLQRALIARALALEPELLLLDEPTASLDERIGRSIWELFEELAREMTVIVVSHDIGAISRNVGRVACLNRRLYGHPSAELSPEVLEAAYGCPVDLIAHGHPHRVLPDHDSESTTEPRS